MSIVRLTILGVVLSIPLVSIFASAEPSKLQVIDADLRETFSDIGHLTTGELANRETSTADIILVDVRTEKEYAVGRIDGAIRISPRASAAEIIEALGEEAEGKDVIFYCSVGVRSSRLASRANSELTEIGARGVYNLSGGVFAWHNEARALVDDKGTTPLVHPYNRSWGKLLERQDYVSMTPGTEDAE